MTSFSFDASGATSSVFGNALNGAEAENGSTGKLGNGVSTSSLDETAMEPQPVPVNVIVYMQWVP